MDKEQLEEMLERHEDRELATNLQLTCNHVATDLISRLEAIECLNGEMKLSSFENAQIVQDYLVRVVEKLYDLPSAQPEIIACRDCKHWICHDKRCGYWNHGVKPLEWCCHAERREEDGTIIST